MVNGRSKTRGFVLIRRNATIVTHGIRIAVPLENSASTHARQRSCCAARGW
jgi:hypothetical protein